MEKGESINPKFNNVEQHLVGNFKYLYLGLSSYSIDGDKIVISTPESISLNEEEIVTENIEKIFNSLKNDSRFNSIMTSKSQDSMSVTANLNIEVEGVKKIEIKLKILPPRKSRKTQ